MRKLSSIIILFVMVLNLMNPLVIDAKQIESDKIKNENLKKSKDNKTSYAPTDIVNIPDTNLKACINRTGIFQPENSNITVEQMGKVAMIMCADSNITDLTGLEFATDLKYLTLQGNENVSDLSPISKLSKIEWVVVNNSPLSDISPLTSLTSLTRLDLSGNQISDISALSNLTNLDYLSITNNQVSNVSALSKLTNLTTLEMGENQISDVSTLSNLTKLLSLELTKNQISDISALSNLTSLVYLDSAKNQISDISALSNLTDLKNLIISENQISDINVLSKLINLHTLDLSVNQISDISALSNLTAIDTLFVNDNKIVDFGPLSKLVLTNFNFNNQISTIDLGVFTNRNDIPSGFPIIGMDGAKHFVSLDLSSIIEGENVITTKYDFSPDYSGDLTIKLIYSGFPKISGADNVEIQKGTEFDPMQGISASDEKDGDLTSKIIITDNNLIESKVGTYKITYSVTDSSMNTTEKSRIVTVVDNTVDPSKPGKDTNKPKDDDNKLMTTGSNLNIVSLLILITLILLKKNSIKN